MSLRLDSVTVELGGRAVLRDVSLAVDAGEMVAVVGPNGSGKSTLVRTMAGLAPAASGEVRVEGRPVRRVSRRELARGVGLLTQSGGVPVMTTVTELVAMGRHAHHRLFAPRQDHSAPIAEAMRRCGIGHLRDRRVDELSGGERQRVRLAALLAQQPRALLLDEPLTGLDIEHQLSLLHLLGDLNREEGHTVVCVLHDLELALRHFGRIVVVHDGRIAGDGRPDEVLCPGLFERVFRVDGRVGREHGGHPVVVCTRPACAGGECATPQVILGPALARASARHSGGVPV